MEAEPQLWVNTFSLQLAVASRLTFCGSLRLATHLLAEGLLDRDHYFDWLLSALNLSRLDTLPVYLFIVGTHLDELGLSRRCGHRLAESLLEHLHKVSGLLNMQPRDLTMVLDRAATLTRRLQNFEYEDCGSRSDVCRL